MALKKRFRFTTYYVRYSFGFLAILAVDLTVNFLMLAMSEYTKVFKPHTITLINMATIMIFFYFFLSYLDRFTKWVLRKIMESNVVWRRRGLGIYLLTLTLFFLLFLGYYYFWNKKAAFSWLPF